ncbi:hypothetical protein X728_24565 [Mesorhizobium sp. L103C120A0]|nr:hypothetical protein X728_24565 [Mesorhizobium sp. L103C120A0]
MALFDARFKDFRWWCKGANLRVYADVRFREAFNTAAVTGMRRRAARFGAASESTGVVLS